MVIGAAVTEHAEWGHRKSAAASRRAGYVSGIYAAAEAAAGSGASADVIGQVTGQLTVLLELRSCRFQHGICGVGTPARLHHDGHVTLDKRTWPADRQRLPPSEVELLVQSGGLLRGRFLTTPVEGARPTLEHRLIAAALADQVGTALSRQHSAHH